MAFNAIPGFSFFWSFFRSACLVRPCAGCLRCGSRCFVEGSTTYGPYDSSPYIEVKAPNPGGWYLVDQGQWSADGITAESWEFEVATDAGGYRAAQHRRRRRIRPVGLASLYPAVPVTLLARCPARPWRPGAVFALREMRSKVIA